MNDEKFLFISDSREKKNVARSARNKRTHCGKGGRVKLPSDYLSKRELNAMSGECKSYKLNEPMLWEEFMSMPDDIKIAYIKLLREKFGVSDKALSEMFGVSTWSVSKEMSRLELSIGKGSGNTHWNKEPFFAWVNRVPTEPVEETQVAEEFVEMVLKPIMPIEENPLVKPLVEIPVEESKPCIPKTGSMVFDGRIEDILKTIGMVLKGADVHLSVHWEVVDNG
jgi:hypothetical protein